MRVSLDPGPLEAGVRDALGARWLRGASVSTAVIVLGSAAASAAGLWSPGWVVATGLLAVLATAALLRLAGALRPTGFVFAAAIVAAGMARFVPSDVLLGIVAAVLLSGIVAIAVFEAGERVLPLSVLLVTISTAAMAMSAGSKAVVVGAPIVAAATVTVALIVGVRTYLTEHAEALARHHLRYRGLFDRVPVGLYRTSLNGHWLDVNPALAELLGFPADALIGTPVRSYLADPEDLDRLRRRLLDDGTPLVTDLELVRADGAVIWVRDRTRAVRDENGDLVWFEGELQDISSQIEHVERLKELIASKSELIAAVSHELRTPLTAVVGFLEVLGEAEESERDGMVKMAAEQANEMATIVDDLLTAARLDNRELVVRAEPVDLVAAVHSAVRSLGDPVTLLSLPVHLAAWADGSRVRQVLRNLIGNAYRYGRPPVTVRGEQSGDVVRITVTDRGTPIPAEVQARMFEAFYTTGRGARQPGSIGLGLAVSRRLAQRMGGDLRHERVGAENRFILELPAEATAVRIA